LFAPQVYPLIASQFAQLTLSLNHCHRYEAVLIPLFSATSPLLPNNMKLPYLQRTTNLENEILDSWNNNIRSDDYFRSKRKPHPWLRYGFELWSFPLSFSRHHSQTFSHCRREKSDGDRPYAAMKLTMTLLWLRWREVRHVLSTLSAFGL